MQDRRAHVKNKNVKREEKEHNPVEDISDNTMVYY